MQKERAANPRGLITKLGGDEFEAPTHLMIPDFIEPVSTQEVEEEEEEDDTTNQVPETQPSSQVCDDGKYSMAWYRVGKLVYGKGRGIESNASDIRNLTIFVGVVHGYGKC